MNKIKDDDSITDVDVKINDGVTTEEDGTSEDGSTIFVDERMAEEDEDGTASEDVIIEDEVTEVSDELKVAEDDEIIIEEAMVVVSGIDGLVTVEEDTTLLDDITGDDEMVQELPLGYVMQETLSKLLTIINNLFILTLN